MSEGLIYRYAGFGEESGFGNAVAATRHVDMLSSTLGPPSDPNIYYDGGLTRARRYHRPGYYAPDGNVVFGATEDTLQSVFYWALGGGSKSESYGADNILLPSFTTRLGKDLYESVVVGCVMNTLELQVDDSFAQITADIIGKQDSKTTVTAFDNLLFEEDPILAFHEMTVSNGFETVDVRSLTLNINNSLDGTAGRSVGSRHPRRIPAGAREVDASIELWYSDTAQLERFWGGASSPDDGGPTEFELTLKLGNFRIQMPRCIVAEIDHDPTGRDRMDQPLTVRALHDTIGAVETEIMCDIEES
jgi:hypothetical protein